MTTLPYNQGQGASMRRIRLSGNVEAHRRLLVDDEDYEAMCMRKWYWHNGYAISVRHMGGGRADRRQEQVVAHRYVLGLYTKDGRIVDHINRNRLDCRKCNLRLVVPQENSWNVSAYSATGYKGVQQQSTNCFSAKLSGVHLGYYRTAYEAALAVDREARATRRGFAYLNVPEVIDYSGLYPLPLRNIGERTSSVVGVSYSHTRRAKGKWRAVYRKEHLGWFCTEQEAIEALGGYKNACS